MDIISINQTHLQKCAELYSNVFSLEPWNENWNEKIALKRLSHFYNSDGFIGIIALKQNNVIGFALGNVEPFLHGDIFYLREMCVNSDMQNCGIGTKILSEIEKELFIKKIKSVYLFTDRKIPATKFYLKHGYALNKDLTIFTKDISFHLIGKNKKKSD